MIALSFWKIRNEFESGLKGRGFEPGRQTPQNNSRFSSPVAAFPV